MRLHLVDGTYELFRAHFSPRAGHHDPAGRDRKATVGLLSSLLALLQDAQEEVTHLAVAFDNPIASFRNRLFAGYKTDEGVPAELLPQFDVAEEGRRRAASPSGRWTTSKPTTRWPPAPRAFSTTWIRCGSSPRTRT